MPKSKYWEMVFNETECVISTLHSYAMIKLVYEICSCPIERAAKTVVKDDQDFIS